jgi:DNA repair/transcription protein MET18/MMS19
MSSPADDVVVTNLTTPLLEAVQSGDFDALSPSTSLQQVSLLILVHITKALVLRTSPLATNLMLPPLMTLLSHPSLGIATARSFATLLAPDDVISKANHAVIRLLHRQRLFTYCVPVLVSSFRSPDTPAAAKPNYLIALSGLLAYVPIEVVLSHLDDLVPLLLQSLDLPSAAVKTATIETLTITIRESPAVLETHIFSLINRLISCATGRTSETPPVGCHRFICPTIRSVESILI